MRAQYHKLPPFPDGWYAIERSDKLKVGELKTKRFLGEDIVVFRTESGVASVMDAYCPHMGAHFGHGGSVEGECIKCPFHGFEFNTEGDCTKTGYGTKPPSRAKVKTFPSQEMNGLILAYHSAEEQEPTWQVPKMDMTDWTDFLWVEWELKSHPQETSENSVDIGHFTETHGYTNVKQLSEPKIDGAHLYVHYGMDRANFLGKNAKPVQIEFKANVHGLGYSIVEAYTKNYDLTTRHFVLPTPTEDGKIILTIGSSIKKIKKSGQIHPMASIVPKSLLNYILSRIVFSGYKHDVSQDFQIWENKKYILRTPLAPGDGPIGMYRVWARQFYSDAQVVNKP